jgi:hypothetical protein
VNIHRLTSGGSFPLPLVGEFQDAGRHFRLVADFAYIDQKDRIVIPAGFTTDFNSIPRPLWVWFPPWQYPEAGVVHDFLYRYPGPRSRKECDEIHRTILHKLGCRKSKRVAAYLGLRAGGWHPWGAYRATSE